MRNAGKSKPLSKGQTLYEQGLAFQKDRVNTGRVNLVEFNDLEFRFGLELELKLERLEGVSKTLRELMYFAPHLFRGRSPPVTKVQNAPALSECLTLPQCMPTLLIRFKKILKHFDTKGHGIA